MQVGDLVRDNKSRYGVVTEIKNVFKPYIQQVKKMSRIFVQGQHIWYFADDLEVINASR